MYQFSIIQDPKVAPLYYKLTFSRYYSKLQACNQESSIVAIAANFAEKPIGLALAEIQSNHEAEVLSIFVEPSHRNQGVGTDLMKHLLDELKKRQCQSVQLVYITGKPSTPALEHLLEKFDWTPPEPRMLVCKGDRRTLSAPWLHKDYRLPSGFSIFPWVEITEQERITLQKEQENESWIPSQLNPFQHEKKMEPLSSMGLRYHNRVVGWLITHRIAIDTIRYTSSYIKPDLQKLGRILALYVETTKRNAAIPELSKAIWTVPFIYPSMVNFVKKHLTSYMISIEESRGSSKRLN